VHQFGDTKHRRVVCRAISTSRFQEYFSDKSLTFTRTSDAVMVSVPSSARPASPEVVYAVPVFGYEQQESTNVRTAVRFGNGIRVYLHRPWYSSGENELLGVTLWPGGSAVQPLTTEKRETYKNYFTQWGLDPIWETGDLNDFPTPSDLTSAVAQGSSLSVEGTDLKVDVAGHCVFYDAPRKLWYSDITFANAAAYTPFVRLTLARYQPHSLPNTELSPVVLADFTQVAADRSAVLSVNPANPRTARIFVGGVSPMAPRRTTFTVTAEKRMPKVATDLGWEESPIPVTQDPPVSGSGSGIPDQVLWSGTVTFPEMPKPGQYRIVVREFETLIVDAPPIAVAGSIPLRRRLVYAVIIPYDFPR
jgi:hypothetical protein